jgi:predicted metalloprotease with PDZ domain
LVNALVIAFLWRSAHESAPAPPENLVMTLVIPDFDIEDAGTGDPRPCADAYVGVGIIFSALTNRVIKVPEHLPAYVAGVRLGDLLVSVTGSPVARIVYVHDNAIHEVRAHTQRICELTEGHRL